MQDRSWFIASFPTSLIFRYHLPLSKDDPAVQYQLVREDPFAEMATSFQTRQAAACDGEVLNLNCPSGTKVWFGFLNLQSIAQCCNLSPSMGARTK
jgi:hypothetical protein